MNIDKAAEGLQLGEDQESSVHDLVLGSLLYGGIRREPSGPDDRASMSPVASPNFEGAKRLLERSLEKGYTMAAVQIGSFYMQEEKLAGGQNLKDGQDAKVLAYEWYKKAADLSNPVSFYFILKNILVSCHLCTNTFVLDGLP
jgi:TPR repeat protein